MHGGLTYNPANGFATRLPAPRASFAVVRTHRRRQYQRAGVAGSFFTTQSARRRPVLAAAASWGPAALRSSRPPTTCLLRPGMRKRVRARSKTRERRAGDRVVSELDTIVASNYPPNIRKISGQDDFDFCATPLLFQTNGCPAMLAAVNKSGMFELYDVGSLSYGPIEFIAMSSPRTGGFRRRSCVRSGNRLV